MNRVREMETEAGVILLGSLFEEKREPCDQGHLRITVKPDVQISSSSSESGHLGVNQLPAAIFLCTEFWVAG